MAIWVGHLGEIVGTGLNATIALLAMAVVAFGLTLEHLHVKHDGLRFRHVRRPVALLLAFALVGAVAPAPGFAQDQDEPRGLPDLISDPPTNAVTRSVLDLDGEVIRVMAFDGYLHNIGTGKLEVSGNPQVEGGMQQRVFDGENWNAVGTPPIQFETTDGHNHFHFMGASEYALWNGDRTEQITEAAKVGFCLVDTEQVEQQYDSNYLLSDFNYCSMDNPDATELIMGITPGWRDTYDANVSLQWVDVSNVAPGLYWLSARIDPNNDIVESNEDNNDLVFSATQFAVDGHVARELDEQQAAEPIKLKSQVYGIAGDRAFVIQDGPANGSLDVPVGFDLLDIDTVRYTPDPGFTGTDSFTYYAHDITTPFPAEPVMVEVLVDASGSPEAQATPPADTPVPFDIVDPGPQVGLHYETAELALELDGPSAPSEARWHSKDLPPGLSIDARTGLISGAVNLFGEFESTVAVWFEGQMTAQQINWSITDQPAPVLIAQSPFSSPGGDYLLRFTLGLGTPGATYRATGLPDGGQIVGNLPMLTGYPRETGTFTVLVQEFIDEEVTDSIEVEWTVRPTTKPAFPL